MAAAPTQPAFDVAFRASMLRHAPDSQSSPRALSAGSVVVTVDDAQAAQTVRVRGQRERATEPISHRGPMRFVSSARNLQRCVARECVLGTLLFDLLTVDEAEEEVFEIPLLAERLLLATRWLDERPMTRDLSRGYFGASTGAAAALVAAARGEREIGAIASRGGRPDLAASALSLVRAPTLLFVGSRDPTVLELNRAALAKLRCTKELAVVPGATHLFEEPGALEEVMRLASDWFAEHLMAEEPT